MPGVTYMPRRTLCPWKAEEIIEETVAWCVEQRVDEIMWLDIDGSRSDLNTSQRRQQDGGVTVAIETQIPSLRTVACILGLN